MMPLGCHAHARVGMRSQDFATYANRWAGLESGLCAAPYAGAFKHGHASGGTARDPSESHFRPANLTSLGKTLSYFYEDFTFFQGTDCAAGRIAQAGPIANRRAIRSRTNSGRRVSNRAGSRFWQTWSRRVAKFLPGQGLVSNHSFRSYGYSLTPCERGPPGAVSRRCQRVERVDQTTTEPGGH